MRTSFLVVLALLCTATVAQAAPCTDPGAIIRVRNTAQPPFEYVIFKLRKPPAIPKYEVKAATPPFSEDPSGNPITIGGSAFTEVSFPSVTWTCEIAEALRLPRKAVVDIKKTGQFEGVVTYVIGRSATAKFISVYSYDSGPGYRSVVVKFKR